MLGFGLSHKDTREVVSDVRHSTNQCALASMYTPKAVKHGLRHLDRLAEFLVVDCKGQGVSI